MTRRLPDRFVDAAHPITRGWVYQPPLKPWLEFKAGMVGYWLICMSIGAMLAEIVKAGPR